jgi:hypothetical protein
LLAAPITSVKKNKKNKQTNECFRSHNNPLYYSLKYSTTAKFRNFWSKVSFIAKNPHLIESKDCESSVIQTRSILGAIFVSSAAGN